MSLLSQIFKRWQSNLEITKLIEHKEKAMNSPYTLWAFLKKNYSVDTAITNIQYPECGWRKSPHCTDGAPSKHLSLPFAGPSAFLEPLPSLSATLLETYLAPNSSSNHSLLFSADELSFYCIPSHGTHPRFLHPNNQVYTTVSVSPSISMEETEDWLFHLSSDFRFLQPPQEPTFGHQHLASLSLTCLFSWCFCQL